jgi:hypothetical protein
VTVSLRPSGIEGAHPLGHFVGELTRIDNNLVELQVQVAKVLANDAPVRLFALHVQFDQVNQNGLQVFAEFFGGVHGVLSIVGKR